MYLWNNLGWYENPNPQSKKGKDCVLLALLLLQEGFALALGAAVEGSATVRTGVQQQVGKCPIVLV